MDSLGLTNDILVEFTTDHGYFFGQHGLHAKGPFLYEDMIKIPMPARLPRSIPVGIESGALRARMGLNSIRADLARKGRSMPRIAGA